MKNCKQGAKVNSRVAPRCIGAPHEHTQHLCDRALSVACSSFLTVADIKCDVGATLRRIPAVSPKARTVNVPGELRRSFVVPETGLLRMTWLGESGTPQDDVPGVFAAMFPSFAAVAVLAVVLLWQNW